MAATMASVEIVELGALLHRAKYVGTVTRSMVHVAAIRTRLERELADAVKTAGASAARLAECRQALERDSVEVQQGVTQLAQLLRPVHC